MAHTSPAHSGMDLQESLWSWQWEWGVWTEQVWHRVLQGQQRYPEIFFLRHSYNCKENAAVLCLRSMGVLRHPRVRLLVHSYLIVFSVITLMDTPGGFLRLVNVGETWYVCISNWFRKNKELSKYRCLFHFFLRNVCYQWKHCMMLSKRNVLRNHFTYYKS